MRVPAPRPGSGPPAAGSSGTAASAIAIQTSIPGKFAAVSGTTASADSIVTTLSGAT